MAELLLNVRDLHAGYGRAEVLHGLTITARAGKVITVIGPNGAGKSTFLNALMGVLPSRGVLRYEGQDISGLTLEERVMAGIALVPEKRELFGTMSVEDNLVLGGWRPKRMRTAGWRSTIDEVYALFPRLKERRAQAAGTLSGGERQMLAIGRALMARPKLLMLDEPSLGLAPLIVKEIFEIVKKLRTTGVTILLIEQNAHMALTIAHRAYVLQTGRVIKSDSAKNLLEDPDVKKAYLGG